MVRRIWADNDPTKPLSAARLNGLEDDVVAKLDLWAANTPYAANQKVVSPDGSIVMAFEAHTSGATYNSALWYSNSYGYLTANFTYNSPEGEKLNLFYSPDGTTITGHGPNPVYAPSTGLRDPSISKIGDKWFMAHGFADPSLKQFALASSPDLINWTNVFTFNVSSVPSMIQSWAPELYQDPDTGDVYIFFTSVQVTNMEVWYVKATNTTTLASWGSPIMLSWTSQPAKAMDPIFTKVGSTWYQFYGDNNYICRATATSLLGPWTTDKTGDWAGWGINKEAPQMVRLGPSRWRLYIDRYEGTSPNWTYPGYAYTESTDLTNWSALTPVVMGPDVQNKIVLRHGSFIRIPDHTTAAQVQGVMDSGAAMVRHAEYTCTTTLTSGVEVSTGTLTLDTSRSFNTTDFTLPAAGQIKVGTSGVYAVSIHGGIGANNFGNGAQAEWVSIFSPTIGNALARSSAYGGYELSAAVPGVMLFAGDIIEFRLTQFTGTSKTIDSRIRITKLN